MPTEATCCPLLSTAARPWPDRVGDKLGVWPGPGIYAAPFSLGDLTRPLGRTVARSAGSAVAETGALARCSPVWVLRTPPFRLPSASRRRSPVHSWARQPSALVVLLFSPTREGVVSAESCWLAGAGTGQRASEPATGWGQGDTPHLRLPSISHPVAPLAPWQPGTPLPGWGPLCGFSAWDVVSAHTAAH